MTNLVSNCPVCIVNNKTFFAHSDPVRFVDQFCKALMGEATPPHELLWLYVTTFTSQPNFGSIQILGRKCSDAHDRLIFYYSRDNTEVYNCDDTSISKYRIKFLLDTGSTIHEATFVDSIDRLYELVTMGEFLPTWHYYIMHITPRQYEPLLTAEECRHLFEMENNTEIILSIVRGKMDEDTAADLAATFDNPIIARFLLHHSTNVSELAYLLNAMCAAKWNSTGRVAELIYQSNKSLIKLATFLDSMSEPPMSPPRFFDASPPTSPISLE